MPHPLATSSLVLALAIALGGCGDGDDFEAAGDSSAAGDTDSASGGDGAAPPPGGSEPPGSGGTPGAVPSPATGGAPGPDGSGGAPTGGSTPGTGGWSTTTGGASPTTGGAPAFTGGAGTGGGPTVTGGAGTGGATEPPTSVSATVMSFNLYGWNALTQNPWKRANLVAQIDATAPDFLGIQEGEGQSASIAADLEAAYAVAGTERHGVGLLYRSDLWLNDSSGTGDLVEQDQWGQRVYVWGHFTHLETGLGVYLFNTHFCVCSKEALQGSATTIATAMAARSEPGDPALLTGDLNVFDGFEASLALQVLRGDLGSPIALLDTYRVVYPDGWVSTFGAAGKVDYVMTTSDVQVAAAGIDSSVPDGQGSDHKPIWATVTITGD